MSIILSKALKKLLDYMFAGNTPEWLLPTISWIIGIALILAGFVFLLELSKKSVDRIYSTNLLQAREYPSSLQAPNVCGSCRK